MICDDQQDILRACALFLRGKYNILTAKSGRECISLYSEQKDGGTKVDLLLLDYRLGDMTGEEVARKIKLENAETKVILITAYELDDLKLSALYQENLIDSQLKKPFSFAELEKKIEQYAI